MKILRAILMRPAFGADHVSLEVDLPDPVDPRELLQLSFKVPRRTGRIYLTQHFPSVPVDDIGPRKPDEETL